MRRVKSWQVAVGVGTAAAVVGFGAAALADDAIRLRDKSDPPALELVEQEDAGGDWSSDDSADSVDSVDSADSPDSPDAPDSADSVDSPDSVDTP